MDVTVYPKHPIISNIEFFCAYLADNGPTSLRELHDAHRAWRGGTMWNFSDVFRRNDRSYDSEQTLKCRRNFIIMVEKRRGYVMLTPQGMSTAAGAKSRSGEVPVVCRHHVCCVCHESQCDTEDCECYMFVFALDASSIDDAKLIVRGAMFARPVFVVDQMFASKHETRIKRHVRRAETWCEKVFKLEFSTFVRLVPAGVSDRTALNELLRGVVVRRSSDS